MQSFGMKFGAFAERRNYVVFVSGERRLQRDQAFNVLHEWLAAKITGEEDPFGWRGYSLTPDQTQEVSTQASRDWLEG